MTTFKKEEFRRLSVTARLLLLSGGSSSQWKRFSTKGNIDTNALHLTCRLEIALVLPLNYSCCHRLWLTRDAVQWRMHNLKTGTCQNALVEASLLDAFTLHMLRWTKVNPFKSTPSLPNFGNLMLIPHNCRASSWIDQIKHKPELKRSLDSV